MPNATYPPTLPQYPLMAAYSQGIDPGFVMRSKMDGGPAKVRRRFTGVIRPVKVELNLTTAQLQTFDSFYLSTCQGGAVPFDWKDYRTNTTVSFRFVSVSDYKPISSGATDADYRVQFDLEILP